MEHSIRPSRSNYVAAQQCPAMAVAPRVSLYCFTKGPDFGPGASTAHVGFFNGPSRPVCEPVVDVFVPAASVEYCPATTILAHPDKSAASPRHVLRFVGGPPPSSWGPRGQWHPGRTRRSARCLGLPSPRRPSKPRKAQQSQAQSQPRKIQPPMTQTLTGVAA